MRSYPMDEIEVLKSVATRLDGGGIPYMLTGSIAVNYYSIPRFPLDMDLVMEIDRSRLEDISDFFIDDFYIDKESLLKRFEKEKRIDLIHRKAIIKMDFIVKKNTEFGRTEMERRQSVPFEGFTLCFASPEDLILFKLFGMKDDKSGEQAKDIIHLLSTVPTLDRTYLNSWLNKLNKIEMFNEVLKMKDTSPDTPSGEREMVMNKSGQERLIIGFSMSNLARKQALSSIMEKNKDLNIQEIRRALFLRLYGKDISLEEKERILNRI